MSDTDRRGSGGNGRSTDPTANVLALQKMAASRQDDLRGALALRLDQRDKMHEIHRLEIAKKDAEILSKEIERSKAEAATEKERVNAVIASDRAAVLLANTEAKAVAAALVVQVETTRKASDAQIESSATALRATNDATTKAQNARFEPLEQARFAGIGVKEQRTEGKSDNRWLIGFLMGLPSVILTVFAVVVLLTQ